MLVCTATLAWGVNLPAHTVVIKVCLCVDKLTCIFIAFTNGWLCIAKLHSVICAKKSFSSGRSTIGLLLRVYIIPYSSIRSVDFQGTQLYDAKAGGWKDLGMLDVMQVKEKLIFGKGHDNAISLVLM